MRSKRDGAMLYGVCAVIAALLLLVCTKSSPLYPLNDWVDTNIYFTIGKGLMRGYVPYLDLYDQKGPTVYLLYGLASLISGKSFFGVYVLETLSFAAFLVLAYRTVALLTEGDNRPMLPVLSALILSSLAVSHGGSLEEFTLPVFAYGLFSFLRYGRAENDAPMPLTVLLVNGLLAGLLLTAKFTLLAFYAAWMAAVFFMECARRRVGRGFACALVFVCGMLLPLGAWLLYFAANGALHDFWYYYFYSNVVSYAAIESPTAASVLLAIGKSTLAAFVKNAQFTALVAIGLLFLACAKRSGVRTGCKRGVWAMALLTACGLYMGGQSYRYYAVVFAAFAPLGMIPVMRWYQRAAAPRLRPSWKKLLPAVLSVLGVGLALLVGSNVYLLGTPKLDTPQYRFANDMRALQTDDALMLLCRAFPDSGFYLAADVIPDGRFFTSNNVMIPDVAAEQVRRVEAGDPEFVVMRDRTDPPSARYALVDTASLPYEQYVCTYYLYQRIPEKE